MLGKNLVGITCDLLWLRKLEKAMAKALEKENVMFGTFIYENNGN